MQRRSVISSLLCAAALGAMPLFALAAEPDNVHVYVGTYSTGDSKAIYRLSLDLNSGELKRVGMVPEQVNPSFLALHPSSRFLYSVNEIGSFGGEKTGAVSAFAVDRRTGDLQQLNQQPSAGGGPCHLVVDKAGKNVLVANYGGGSVACLPIGDDGRLKPPSSSIQHKGSSVTPRQKGPHAHSINLDPAGKFAFAADLGLDKVLIYMFDAEQGELTPHGDAHVKPGAGPRHFAFHPGGRFAYVINELDNTVTAFACDPRAGTLKQIQNITTLPKGYQETSYTADVQVHRSGKFLYGSNRGHDSIAVFAIDSESGKLAPVEQEPTGGNFPRNFGMDPSGRFLLVANQNSDNIVVLRIDQKSGGLTPTGHEIEIPKPVCLKFLHLEE